MLHLLAFLACSTIIRLMGRKPEAHHQLLIAQSQSSEGKSKLTCRTETYFCSPKHFLIFRGGVQEPFKLYLQHTKEVRS